MGKPAADPLETYNLTFFKFFLWFIFAENLYLWHKFD